MSCPHRATHLDGSDGLLLVRDWEDGPETVIPRKQWRSARETGEGRVESAEHINLETGFIPGKIYHFAGIRLPDLEVPVGTHTGWNLRHPETGAPEQMIPMQGFTSFFAPTQSAREAAGDARPSLAERYKSRDDYIVRVREAASRLATERYILEEDVEIVVSACVERYDAAMMQAVAV